MKYTMALHLAIITLALSSYCRGTEREPQKFADPAKAAEVDKPTRPERTDVLEAISLSLAELQSRTEAPADYRLIKAEQIVVNGKYVWRITFKPENLLPSDPSRGIIGAGGEVFVNVDLDTKEATVQYGE